LKDFLLQLPSVELRGEGTQLSVGRVAPARPKRRSERHKAQQTPPVASAAQPREDRSSSEQRKSKSATPETAIMNRLDAEDAEKYSGPTAMEQFHDDESQQSQATDA